VLLRRVGAHRSDCYVTQRKWVWPVSRCHLFGAGFGGLRWSDMQAILGEQLAGLLCVEFSTLPLLLDW